MGQAQRPGQQRSVTIYWLVRAWSLEERIMALHIEKRELANSAPCGQGSDMLGRRLRAPGEDWHDARRLRQAEWDENGRVLPSGSPGQGRRQAGVRGQRSAATTTGRTDPKQCRTDKCKGGGLRHAVAAAVRHKDGGLVRKVVPALLSVRVTRDGVARVVVADL